MSEIYFNDEHPSNGEVILCAFYQYMDASFVRANFPMSILERCVKRTLKKFAELGEELWNLESREVELISDQAIYPVTQDTLAIVSMEIIGRQGEGGNESFLLPIKCSEYAQITEKSLSGNPRFVRFDCLKDPQFLLWPVPQQSIPKLRVRVNSLIWQKKPEGFRLQSWLSALALAMAVDMRMYYPVGALSQHLLERKAAAAYRFATFRLE